jgi:two-component system cell cycle sensor histidine kinase PleC
MRSAETSGATAKGAVAAKTGRGATFHWPVASLTKLIGTPIAALSPLTLAVAVTALLGATLFIVYDTLRTFDEARQRLELVAQSVGADFTAAAAPAANLAALVHRVLAYDEDIVVAAGPDAALPANDPLSLGIELRGLGNVRLSYDRHDLLVALWQRGLLALGIAAAAAGLAFQPGRRFTRSRRGERQAFQNFVATIPFGVAMWTRAGELIVCNEHYAARLKSEGSPQGPDRSYHSAIKRLTLGGYVRVLSDGDASRTLELHRQDGSCLLIDERPLGGDGFVTLVTDITERKRTDLLLNALQEEQRQLARRYHEEKLRAEAASRAKTSFLAHLSHDIRTPLNHIIGFAELIRHQTYGPLGDARYLTYVEMIKGSGDKLLASFATILELAELESGSKPLREEEVEIDDLLSGVTRRFSAQASRAGLTLGIGGCCTAQLLADRFCLERMLGNLVENAIRFTPSGGRVTLAAYAAEDGVVLEVSDSGIGMTAEQLSRLSQPFAFGDAAFTREHDGAGLGIAIARAIAELSGGRLAIDSSPALGTTVAISLTQHSREAAQAA